MFFAYRIHKVSIVCWNELLFLLLLFFLMFHWITRSERDRVVDELRRQLLHTQDESEQRIKECMQIFSHSLTLTERHSFCLLLSVLFVIVVVLVIYCPMMGSWLPFNATICLHFSTSIFCPRYGSIGIDTIFRRQCNFPSTKQISSFPLFRNRLLQYKMHMYVVILW